MLWFFFSLVEIFLSSHRMSVHNYNEIHYFDLYLFRSSSDCNGFVCDICGFCDCNGTAFGDNCQCNDTNNPCPVGNNPIRGVEETCSGPGN